MGVYTDNILPLLDGLARRAFCGGWRNPLATARPLLPTSQNFDAHPVGKNQESFCLICYLTLKWWHRFIHLDNGANETQPNDLVIVYPPYVILACIKRESIGRTDRFPLKTWYCLPFLCKDVLLAELPDYVISSVARNPYNLPFAQNLVWKNRLAHQFPFLPTAIRIKVRLQGFLPLVEMT